MFETRPKKSLGQVFLINEKIAVAEAEHAHGKTVLEMGSGKGILTKELLSRAKKVIAVEKDQRLCTLLNNNFNTKKLKLIHGDFFDVSDKELELKDVDIMISNIPYMLSSRTIEWLSQKRMQAVLCLQKEFVDHMLAPEDTDNYSKLSVISSLSFSITKIMNVPRGNFRPIPKVDSAIIYLKPKEVNITGVEMHIINALMQHKKKTVRNAMMDCEREFGKSKHEMSSVMEKLYIKDQRVFKLSPKELLAVAKELSENLQ
jgi:16S rRNA (adenine1518-N6/adenine1519-N6)-dimethyltransferase